jgi:hypothetical protein
MNIVSRLRTFSPLKFESVRKAFLAAHRLTVKSNTFKVNVSILTQKKLCQIGISGYILDMAVYESY